MKRKIVFTACALVLVITGVLASKASSKRIDASYTMSTTGTACWYPASLPSGCGISQTGTVCATVSGATTFKYYQGMDCVLPYYRNN